jgi:CubicO group peptidase (beta-lactamase class C family)
VRRATSQSVTSGFNRTFALVALALAVACASVPPASTPARRIFPAAEWERATAAAGYCEDKLDLVTARARALPTTGMMAIVGGRIIYEYGDVRRVSYLASVRKSILAMLFGKYVETGRVKLDKTLADLNIDDLGGLLPSEKEATVADLLAARSGVYHAASNAGDSLADAPPRGSQNHGTYFLYSNWDFNALGTIFEQETGQSIFDRAIHRRTGDATKSTHLAYHMHLSTRDMARVGYVMLRHGEWDGRTIVPRSWVRRIVTPVTRVHEMNPPALRKGPFGYGYLWWVWDGEWARDAYDGAYTGIGAIGQFITVLPRLDMVVAHKTVPSGQAVSRAQYLELIQRLVAARCN